MAAGQHRVSRRIVSDLYSRKENSQCRNAHPDAGRRIRDEIVEPRNLSKSQILGRNLDVSVVRTRKDDVHRVSSEAPVSVLGDKGREISAPEDRAELPPQKKRKFSPIIWDEKEKEVRISSKNRVIKPVALSTPLPLPPSLCIRASEGSSDGPDSEYVSSPPNISPGAKDLSGPAPDAGELAPAAVSGFPDTSSTMPLDHIGADSRKSAHMENDELFLARSISMSRWASDSESPREVHLKGSNSVVESEMSSPESGEFLREDSEMVSRGSSVSGDNYFIQTSSRDCLRNESGDDVKSGGDVKSGDDVGANELDSDSEDVIDSRQLQEPKICIGRDINMLQGCRDVSEYERLNRISEGTYGVVYRARDKKTGEIVALKKVKMGIERDGFPLSALREMNILLSFRHPAVVDVKEVVMGDLDSIFMVMEYMEHDLKGLMEKMKHPFSISEVKCLMLQLLEGVKYLHDNWVLHRDLKTSNLLMNNRGELKVCDLGLSRQYGSPLKPYTPLVVTLWYRAPELLLGTKQYSTAIDMWSVGCIMAEFLAKKPLFAGETEVSQLDKIFGVLGMPSEANWPGYSELPGPGVKVNFKAKQPYSLLRRKFPATSFIGSPALSESGFDLLSKLLTYDPAKRISAEDALDHEWFREVPLPKCKDFMPTFPPSMPKASGKL